MPIHPTIRKLAFGAAAAIAAAPLFAAAAPQPFTATYQVLRDGQAIGQATVRLSAGDDGEYTYSDQIKGTSGLAAVLGASSSETTRLRWTGGMPETVSYDYRMEAAIKRKQRHLQVDWNARQVQVTDNRKAFSYAAAPGMVDRNLLPYALGLALRDGKRAVSLPVGVKQRVENQQFQVQGTEAVQVPAGSFQAERISRTDAERAFDAWYAPKKYPVPVKLSQSDGGNLTLQLVSYSQP